MSDAILTRCVFVLTRPWRLERHETSPGVQSGDFRSEHQGRLGRQVRQVEAWKVADELLLQPSYRALLIAIRRFADLAKAEYLAQQTRYSLDIGRHVI